MVALVETTPNRPTCYVHAYVVFVFLKLFHRLNYVGYVRRPHRGADIATYLSHAATSGIQTQSSRSSIRRFDTKRRYNFLNSRSDWPRSNMRLRLRSVNQRSIWTPCNPSGALHSFGSSAPSSFINRTSLARHASSSSVRSRSDGSEPTASTGTRLAPHSIASVLALTVSILPSRVFCEYSTSTSAALKLIANPSRPSRILVMIRCRVA